ncbi:MAG TPA: nuclear transport factor 2 family protein [Usitatibacter sp.]|nr:nuclear transport factor 2 family protein [Usitatibacter sp.]
MKVVARLAACCVLPALLACASAVPGGSPSRAELARQVEATERAFAKTMADRDPEAFASFLAEEAIFFSGEEPLRGKRIVAERWARFFHGSEAPFSWEPDRVEVLDSGTLALSTGPVRNPRGRIVARFNSIWRRESPGVWRIVFDRGSPVCDRP